MLEALRASKPTKERDSGNQWFTILPSKLHLITSLEESCNSQELDEMKNIVVPQGMHWSANKS